MESGELSKGLLGSLELNRIYQQDCLDGMKFIPDKSIDMILCDLPYGTTSCSWDVLIPFDPLWEQYERIIKDDGAIVLTATQPFASQLINSNIKWFRHEWIWRKNKGANFMNLKNAPNKIHENILVFGKNKVKYNPLMWQIDESKRTKRKTLRTDEIRGNNIYKPTGKIRKIDTGERYPLSVLEFDVPYTPKNTANNIDHKNQDVRVHPTQKPFKLFEYLINTYTSEGEIVLDNCMGSGTTAVACVKTNRKFIGFETEPQYIEISNLRIEATYSEIDDEKILE